MPRQARIVVPGHPYHVTQRGNSRQPIFREDNDRLQYLSWITDYSLKYHLSVLGYCLMDNHVHLIVLPQRDNALAKTLSITYMRKEGRKITWEEAKGAAERKAKKSP
jgi:putative transposase